MKTTVSTSSGYGDGSGRGMKRMREGQEMETVAPTSSSCGDGSRRRYDVFLNFRGPDTNLTIVNCLYNDINRVGIRVFVDNEDLRPGNYIMKGLEQAINESRIYIPIFSKNYTTSKWPLDELVQIVESCEKSKEKVIIPIFWDVETYDLKSETGLYRKALQKPESPRGKYSVEQWEKALVEVGGISGWELKNYGMDALKNLMVKEVCNLLWTRRTEVPDHLVGIKDQMNDIMKQLELKTLDVRFIVIHGMGGIGKTTLADAIFRQISPQFKDRCCFLKDFGAHDIVHLQNKLLSKILNLRLKDLDSIDDGDDMITQRFSDKKVFIVLDGINHIDQISRLAGKPHCFDAGSRIIITTRDINFLPKEGKDDNAPTSNNGRFLFYDVPLMNKDDALKLFCQCAFGDTKPPFDFVEISVDLVEMLGRLPLALLIVGSTLHGECLGTWNNTRLKLKVVMNKDVKEKLMISYEALEPFQQQIFLDIACFFINRDKATAIRYWDAIFPYSSEIEVSTLIRKSLIRILDDDKLWMHDQLVLLGRNIVDLKSGDPEQKGSRLWSPKDAFPVVRRKMGTEKIVALNLGTPEPDAGYIYKYEEFERLLNLRFLQLDSGNFEGDFEEIFSELIWLSWSNCPLEFRATNFGLKNLTILELSGDHITEDWGGWSQIMVAKHLKVLKLVDCPSLGKTPEFSAIAELERLILKGCKKLSIIDESIGNLQKLEQLEIGNAAIESLPESIGGLKSLSKLTILDCLYLEELPDSIGQLESLLELFIDSSRIGELPRSIGDLQSLQVLRMKGCEPLSSTSLEALGIPEEVIAEVLSHMNGEIPSEIGALSELRILEISHGNFSTLPTTINQLTSLQELRLFECNKIQQLPELPPSLTVLHISSESLTTIPDLSNLTNLVNLDMRGGQVQELSVEWLVRLSALRMLALSGKGTTFPQIDWSSLSQLQELEISCADTRSVTGLPSNLQKLTLNDVQSPIELSLFCNLENLSVLRVGCYQPGELRFDGPGKLPKLNELMIAACPSLKTLPVLPLFEDIRVFNLYLLPQLTEIQGLEGLKSLQVLRIFECKSIQRLPKTALSSLQNLDCLDFYSCELLESVPDVPYAKPSCQLTIRCCPKLRDFEGPYRSYKDG